MTIESTNSESEEEILEGLHHLEQQVAELLRDRSEYRTNKIVHKAGS